MKKFCFVTVSLMSFLLAGFANAQLNLKNPEPNDVLNDLVGVPGNELTSSPTLNVFFANKISTYLSEASDLSLSKAYAVLDNTDGRLFIGGTFNSKRSLINFTRFITTGGVKLNVKDGFSSIFNDKNFNNDIGFSIKSTLFGKGIITFATDPAIQKNIIGEKRKSLQYKILNDFDRDLAIEKDAQIGNYNYVTNVQKFVTDRTKEAVEQFVKEEAAFISNERLFNLAHSWWLSLDAYVPITKSQYNVSPRVNDLNFSNQNYMPYELNIAYTNLWDKNLWGGNSLSYVLPRGISLLTFKFSLRSNNSASANLIEAYSFDRYLQQIPVIDTMFLAKLKTSTVYVGDFAKFITPQLSGRYVYLPVSFIGISAAFEKNLGRINDLNWKLGIPVSLKDNEGKAKINFELVWREYFKAHTIGLSVGLPIGKNIFQ